MIATYMWYVSAIRDALYPYFGHRIIDNMYKYEDPTNMNIDNMIQLPLWKMIVLMMDKQPGY